MKKRTIMIFPEFKNLNIIDNIRNKYDPLASHVRPHISLVFTFESEIKEEELKKHIDKVLKKCKSFKLTMRKFAGINNELGKYIFLTIDEGYEEIKELSRKLYTGILKDIKPGWLNDDTYMPI